MLFQLSSSSTTIILQSHCEMQNWVWMQTKGHWDGSAERESHFPLFLEGFSWPWLGFAMLYMGPSFWMKDCCIIWHELIPGTTSPFTSTTSTSITVWASHCWSGCWLLCHKWVCSWLLHPSYLRTWLSAFSHKLWHLLPSTRCALLTNISLGFTVSTCDHKFLENVIFLVCQKLTWFFWCGRSLLHSILCGSFAFYPLLYHGASWVGRQVHCVCACGLLLRYIGWDGPIFWSFKGKMCSFSYG